MTDLHDRVQSAVAGRYRLVRELGQGGMATVYLARDEKHDRDVAIKVLKPELAVSVGSERFLREIQIAAQLRHPHILSLIDSGEVDGLPFYVMPFVEGESLRDRLDREYQLPIEDAVRLTREVADALDHAHAQGVIHRDIKPENIMLEAGHAVVADFGIARAVNEAGGTKLTETGMAVGTPAYMSPEQATGAGHVDGRSDVYSLACVLYEMLSGEPPYAGPTPMAVIAKKLGEPTPHISVVRETVPAGFEQVFTKGLAKAPADRYATPGALAAALEHPRATGRPRRWGMRVFGMLGAAAVVLVTGLAVRALTRPFHLTASNPRQLTFDPGIEARPALSPDGSTVAYATGLRQENVVVQSSSGGTARVVAENDFGSGAFRWSADGERLLFGAWPKRDRGSFFQFFEVEKLGGPVRAAIRPRGFNPAMSPDGRWAAYWRRGTVDSISGQRADDTILVSAVGEDAEASETVFAVVPGPSISKHSLAWSPDASRIAYVQGGNPGQLIANEDFTSAVWVVERGGVPVRVTDGQHRTGSPRWFPDNRHLLFVSDRDGPRDVYVVDTRRPGTPQRVTFGGQDPRGLSLSADGRQLAYSRWTFRRNIWALPIPRSGSVSLAAGEPVTAVGWGQLVQGHSLSPDGDSIVFDFRPDPAGPFHVFKMALAGGTAIPLTSGDANDSRPVWSPSGREIAFSRDPHDLWVMDSDGANPRKVVDSLGGMGYYAWSPDGRSLVYEKGAEGTWLATRESLRNGFDVPVPFEDFSRLSDLECQTPNWAPLGEDIVCAAPPPPRPGSDGAIFSLFWLSPEGEMMRRWDSPSAETLFNEQWAGMQGQPRGPPRVFFLRHPTYSPDGSTIYGFGIDNASDSTGGHQNFGIFAMPAQGGEPRLVVRFSRSAHDLGRVVHIWAPHTNGTRYGALTVGEEHLYLSVSDDASDIWLVDLDW